MIKIKVPPYNERTKTLVHYSKEFLPMLIKQFPLEDYYTKTIATIIGIIAENNKHNNNNPIYIEIINNNNNIIISAKDNGPGLKLPILMSIKEKTSTMQYSLGNGLHSLLITTVSCGGSLFIQSKNLKEAYVFQKTNKNISNQINLDEITSAIKKPYKETINIGLIIKTTIPINNLRRKTAQIDLDKYFNF